MITLTEVTTIIPDPIDHDTAVVLSERTATVTSNDPSVADREESEFAMFLLEDGELIRVL